MSRLAIKSGYMTKKNESGAWQRRYCVLVPHTFLYYFDTDEGDVPRGIIDLEYYTDISADDKHVIKVCPQTHQPSHPQSSTPREARGLPQRAVREAHDGR
jgi:hypothetical protein